ncbi:MAG TPA: sterol desaturase family protein, partial [Novosphingobium sp.]|nr:sterol desaturase family protein [Novosphingobium sp.]
MGAFDPVTLAIPGFVLLVLAEMLRARRRSPQAYEPADTMTSLGLGLGNTVAAALTAGIVFSAMTFLFDHRVAALGWHWWVWIAAFVLDDFNYYWAHRTGHRVRWFWAAHVNHHSSQHYNLSTALRQTWTGFAALSFLFRIWPALLGFPPAMLVAVAGINLIYQFWIHTEVIDKLGRAEAVLNSPSLHRVHHGSNRRYLDRNHGSILICWDRLFGTFEREREPVVYGLTKNINTFNPARVASHEHVDILRDVRGAES